MEPFSGRLRIVIIEHYEVKVRNCTPKSVRPGVMTSKKEKREAGHRAEQSREEIFLQHIRARWLIEVVRRRSRMEEEKGTRVKTK